jgi:hypothetical protein
MLGSLLYVPWVVGRDRIGFESSPSVWTSVVGRRGCRSSREDANVQVEAMPAV